MVTSCVENGIEEERIYAATDNKNGSYDLVSYFFTDHAISSLKMVGHNRGPVHPKLYKSVSCVHTMVLLKPQVINCIMYSLLVTP